MEIRFENSYVINKELAKEIYRYFYFQRPYRIVIYSILAINFLIYIFYATIGWHYNIILPVSIVLYFAFQCYAYFYQVNIMIKRNREAGEEDRPVCTIVTDEYIQVNAPNGAKAEVQYSNIRRVTRTKNLILLHTRANLMYIFRNDAFGRGGKDQFVAFLREKGVKIK